MSLRGLGYGSIGRYNLYELLFQGFVRICSRICSNLFQIGLGGVWICSNLILERICRPDNHLEGRRLREDILCRRISIGLQFICNQTNAHSETVDIAQGSHYTGDKRVSVVCLGGEILWTGFPVEVAGVVKLQTVSVFIYVSR